MAVTPVTAYDDVPLHNSQRRATHDNPAPRSQARKVWLDFYDMMSGLLPF